MPTEELPATTVERLGTGPATAGLHPAEAVPKAVATSRGKVAGTTAAKAKAKMVLAKERIKEERPREKVKAKEKERAKERT